MKTLGILRGSGKSAKCLVITGLAPRRKALAEAGEERSRVKSRAAMYVVLAGLSAMIAFPAWSQPTEEQEKVLEAIRSGRLKVTEEALEAQRGLHPELRGISDEEIRKKLEKPEAR